MCTSQMWKSHISLYPSSAFQHQGFPSRFEEGFQTKLRRNPIHRWKMFCLPLLQTLSMETETEQLLQGQCLCRCSKDTWGTAPLKSVEDEMCESKICSLRQTGFVGWLFSSVWHIYMLSYLLERWIIQKQGTREQLAVSTYSARGLGTHSGGNLTVFQL